MKLKRYFIILICAALFSTACKKTQVVEIDVRPSLEDRTEEGNLYTSSTQSILRQAHWLEKVNKIDLAIEKDYVAKVKFKSDDQKHNVELINVPIDQLVPRLHYNLKNQPDEFDAFNLRMAEYARNGLMLPKGNKGDDIAHFESDFEETAPWNLLGDYKFEANPSFKPLRIGIINNCLAPGLWELNAVDRAGEIYHSWFEFPKDLYYKITAEVNDLPIEFVTDAVQWKSDKAKMDMDRLRTKISTIADLPFEVIDTDPGFSTQESRKKLARGFAKVKIYDELVMPETLKDYKENPVCLSDFIEPGKYSYTNRKIFDVSFLFESESVEFNKVKPLTNYNWNKNRKVTFADKNYIELNIKLKNNFQLLIGNLPISLLVQQEDFAVSSFGVGILAPSEVAERRNLLIDNGPHPHYAYLAEKKDGELMAINSHEAGVEQVFIRAFPFAKEPNILVTITSFERITDLVKYRLAIPKELLAEFKNSTKKYRSPVFYTYRDDNLR